MPTLISWNIQGDGGSKLGESYSDLLSERKDHIIMIQEFGNPNQLDSEFNTNEALTIEKSYAKFGSREYLHEFDVYSVKQTNCKNQRCSTSLFIEWGYKVSDCKIFPPNYKKDGITFKRPVVYCRCQRENEEYYIGTVHLTATDNVAKKQLTKIYDEFNKMFPKKKWIIMGDFNCEPKEFDPKDERNKSHPGSKTHREGKILDYAIFSDSLRGQIHVKIGGATGRQFVPLASDHWPIHCIF